MRVTMSPVTMLLLSASLSAFAAQAEPAGASPTHRTQVLRAGKGEPRVRDAASARRATDRPQAAAEGRGRSRPYQPAKPGEGAPKD